MGVFADLNLPDEELAVLTASSGGGRGAAAQAVSTVCRRLRTAAVPGTRSASFSDEDGCATSAHAHVDRILLCGGVFGCAYLVGKRKQFGL